MISATPRVNEYDPPHSLIAAHADTERRFHLTLVNTQDGGTDRLCHVGGEVQCQTDDGGGKGIHSHEDGEQLRQSVVEQEQLDEQRRTSKERDIEHRQPVDHGDAKHPYYRQGQRQYECQDESPQGHFHRGAQVFEQDGEQP